MATVSTVAMRVGRIAGAAGFGAGLSFGLQGLFAVVLLRLYLPVDVAAFSLVSQVAYLWTTLALAQAPVTWLVTARDGNVFRLKPQLSAIGCRFLYLSPLVYVALLISDTGNIVWIILSAAALGLGQAGWQLSQSITLIHASEKAIVINRALPPLVGLCVALIGTRLVDIKGSTVLLVAAALGYWFGAFWLLGSKKTTSAGNSYSVKSEQSDDRSTTLRISHSATDALAMLAIILVWQRLYGGAEAGYLAIALRVLGFAPMLVHTAWAQVLLAHGRSLALRPLAMGGIGTVLVVLLGMACDFAIQRSWLAASWLGLADYLVPVVIWQACACIFAAYSHLSFRSNAASKMSYLSIIHNATLIVGLILPIALGVTWTPEQHLWGISIYSATALLGLATRVVCFNTRHIEKAKRLL